MNHWTAWTVWQRSGGKWVRKEVVGREVVKVKEVELAAAEEEIRKRKQEARREGGVRGVKGGVKKMEVGAGG